MKATQSIAALALATGLPLVATAQTTIFTDDFATDSSLATPPWYNMNNASGAATATLNPTAGQGLALDVSTGTGKVNEEFAQFASTPVTLATVGDYITLTVDFNSSDVSGNTGGLLAALLNTQGTVASANESSSTTGGATADDTGYFGIMGYNTSAGTSTKFYSRQGGASDANELGYYSFMTASSYTQVGTFAATGNANLANSTAYTLIYTVTKGASSDTITAMIDQGATTLDSWTSTDASGLYNSFDELDFGFYGKNALIDGNITEIQVADSIQSVPEPSPLALSGLGILSFSALQLARRVKRQTR